MNSRNQSGFSLVELLMVVAVIGVVVSIAIPGLSKGVRAAENGSVVATLRTVSSTQVNYYSSSNRFGRLGELNNLVGRGIGSPCGANLCRNNFVLEMVPAAPTDAELRDGFIVTATRAVAGENIYKYEVTQTGEIRQILP